MLKSSRPLLITLALLALVAGAGRPAHPAMASPYVISIGTAALNSGDPHYVSQINYDRDIDLGLYLENYYFPDGADTAEAAILFEYSFPNEPCGQCKDGPNANDFCEDADSSPFVLCRNLSQGQTCDNTGPTVAPNPCYTFQSVSEFYSEGIVDSPATNGARILLNDGGKNLVWWNPLTGPPASPFLRLTNLTTQPVRIVLEVSSGTDGCFTLSNGSGSASLYGHASGGTSSSATGMLLEWEVGGASTVYFTESTDSCGTGHATQGDLGVQALFFLPVPSPSPGGNGQAPGGVVETALTTSEPTPTTVPTLAPTSTPIVVPPFVPPSYPTATFTPTATDTPVPTSTFTATATRTATLVPTTVPTSTSTPTSGASPNPPSTGTSTPPPSATSIPTSTATLVPPPAPNQAPMTPASPTPPPTLPPSPTPVPHPKKPSVQLANTSVQAGKRLKGVIQTAPDALLTLTFQVKMQDVVVYQAIKRGAADDTGRYAFRMKIGFHPPSDTTAKLIVQVTTPGGSAKKSIPVTLHP